MRKLRIETWIDQNNFDESSEALMNEAIVCYKGGAYRAALHFSFMFFCNVIRHRVLKTEYKPNNCSQGQWDGVRKSITDASTWDLEVIKLLNANNSNIFYVDDELRLQVRYWKDRRNDAVHAKPNQIDLSHVESFWLFLISNLPKFAVNGSKEALLEKISKHFDSTQTAPGKDMGYILRDIPHAIPHNDYEEFFKSAMSLFTTDEDDLPFPYIASEKLKFWDALFDQSSDAPYVEALVDVTASSEFVLREFLLEFPQRIVFFSDKEAALRILWKSLFKGTVSSDEMAVFCAFISNELVSGHPITPSELNQKVKILAVSRFYKKPTSSQLEIIKTVGYEDVYKEEVFKSKKFSRYGGFEYANLNAPTIVQFLEFCKIDDIVAAEINYLREQLLYGTFLESLKELLKRRPDIEEKLDSFKTV